MDYKPRCYKPQYGAKFQLFYRLMPTEEQLRGEKQLPTWVHWEYAASSAERTKMLSESRVDNPLYEFESVILPHKWWPNMVVCG